MLPTKSSRVRRHDSRRPGLSVQHHGHPNTPAVLPAESERHHRRKTAVHAHAGRCCSARRQRRHGSPDVRSHVAAAVHPRNADPVPRGHAQAAAGFLMTMADDSIEGIFETVKRCALISKGAYQLFLVLSFVISINTGNSVHCLVVLLFTLLFQVCCCYGKQSLTQFRSHSS